MKKAIYNICPIFLIFLSCHTYGKEIMVEPLSALEAHNNIRKFLNAGLYSGQVKPNPAIPLMVWSEELAHSALRHAQRCVLAHSHDRVDSGENIYASTQATTSIENAVESWAQERQFYHYGSNQCDDGKVCGHYTQLVWDNSEQLGCGINICEKLYSEQNQLLMANAKLIVCQYRAAGNIWNQYPYENRRHSPTDSQYHSHQRTLHIPQVKVLYTDRSEQFFSAQLIEVESGIFQLNSYQLLEQVSDGYHNQLNLNTNRLYLPTVEVISNNPNTSNPQSELYSAELDYVPHTEPMRFRLRQSIKHAQ